MTKTAVQLISMGLHLDLAQGVGFENFARWIEGGLVQARLLYAETSLRLLVFPEYCTLPLVYDEDTAKAHSEAVFSFFSELAKAENSYVLACSPVFYNDKAFNRASLFDSDGIELLRVHKQHLTQEEQLLGFEPGNENETVVETPFGKVGIAICLDAFSPQYRDHLYEQEVDILLMPSANPQPWAAPSRGSGVWQPLEWMGATLGIVTDPLSTVNWLVNPMLRGGLDLGVEFDGQSAIVRPSATSRQCPYLGVKRMTVAEFIHCGPDRMVMAHDIGCVIAK